MKRSEINAWTAALRSGDYKQGKTQLANFGGESMSFCCLGVFCEIHPLVTRLNRCSSFYFAGHAERIVLPRGIADMHDFRDITGHFQITKGEEKQRLEDIARKHDGIEAVRKCITRQATDQAPDTVLLSFSLTALNDEGLSFDGIADVIEAFDSAIFRTIEEDV